MFSDSIILVAGADLKDRETILQALGDQCHVVAAQTADDALAHQENTVELVISDLQSSQLNGLDLLRRWKRRQPRTPFLVLTDGRDVSSAVEVMKSGAADCIVKPIDADELRASASQLVDCLQVGSSADSNGGNPSGSPRKPSIDIPPGTSLEELERAAVEQTLIQHQGNRTHAAKTLGISVRTLQRKLKAWGIPIVPLQNSSAANSLVMSAHGVSPSMFSAHFH